MPKTNFVQSITEEDNIALCAHLFTHKRCLYECMLFYYTVKYFKVLVSFLKNAGYIDYACLNFHFAFRETKKKVTQITNYCIYVSPISHL